MSSYPYIGQLGPAVGGGLGGIPRRQSNVVDAPYVNQSLIRNSLLDTAVAGVSGTTYPGVAIISDDIFVLMDSANCYLKKGVSGALVANASLTSFFGGTTVTSRTLIRLTGSDYVIANTSASGSWKFWLLRVNDFSLPLASITFTPVMDITSLNIFSVVLAYRLTSCTELGGGKYLVSVASLSGGSIPPFVVSIGVDTLSLISSSLAPYGGLLFPAKKYKNCFFLFGRSNSGSNATISAFCVNDSGIIADFTGTVYHAGNINTSLVSLDLDSAVFDNGKKYTVNINNNSLVEQAGVYFTGRPSFRPYTQDGMGRIAFSTNQAMLLTEPGGAAQQLIVIRPDAETGYLYGEIIKSSTSMYYGNAGSYGGNFIAYGNTAGNASATSIYYKEA